jgi:hypothetical protein
MITVSTSVNLAARFLPMDPADPDTLPCVEIGGVQVYVYFTAAGVLTVSAHYDTTEPQMQTSGGNVPTRVDLGGEVVFETADVGSAERAAAIDRLAAMVYILDGDALGKLLLETTQVHIEEQLADRDFSPLGDDVVAGALRDRLRDHEEYDAGQHGSFGPAALLFDVLGERRATVELVDYAQGDLCDDDEDGLCGADTRDGEGWDGKCGNCADRAAFRRGEV